MHHHWGRSHSLRCPQLLAFKIETFFFSAELAQLTIHPINLLRKMNFPRLDNRLCVGFGRLRDSQLLRLLHAGQPAGRRQNQSLLVYIFWA